MQAAGQTAVLELQEVRREKGGRALPVGRICRVGGFGLAQAAPPSPTLRVIPPPPAPQRGFALLGRGRGTITSVGPAAAMRESAPELPGTVESVAEVLDREGAEVLIYDEEFADLLSEGGSGMKRVVAFSELSAAA